MDSSTNDKQPDEWQDITDEFKEACGMLKVGELVHDRTFGLFEAMSAFEMMDPKMDSGIIGQPSSQPSKTVSDLKLKDFSNAEIISIVDGTLCCIASWLEGGSMVQTVFANVYLHQPLLIENRILKAFSVGMLKLVGICKDFITSTGVYEDEHFQPSTHGFELADSTSEQRIVGMLKEAEDELMKMVRSTKSKLQEKTGEEGSSDKSCTAEELNSLNEVLARLRIVKLLISSILALKYSGTPMTEEMIGKGLDKLNDAIRAVSKSVQCQPVVDPLTLPMFDIAATSRLLPPSFPRTIQIMTISDTLNLFSKMCAHLQTINSMPKKMGLVETMDYFDKFSYKQPSILIRSLLLYHYMPTGTGKVFNKQRLTELVADELRAFNSPPLFSPAYKSTLMVVEPVKLVLNAFLGSAAHVLDNLFVAKCNTRARQRERLAMLLEELGVLQTDAERVDSVVDSVITDKLGEKAVGHQASSIGTWVLFLTTRTMMKYLTLSVELELFDIREYCYYFWYMSEVVLLWNTSSLFRAEKSLAEPAYLDFKAGGGKKKNKQKKAIKGAASIHHDELMSTRCKQHLSGGLYKLLLALKSTNMLPTTGDYTYDNEKVRYTHRFSPFAAVNFPQMAFYHSYVEAVGKHETAPTPIIVDFLRQSLRNFETAKSIIETDLMKTDVKSNSSLLAVAKYNMVSTKVLADSVQKGTTRSIKFDFGNHAVFPMVKVLSDGTLG